MTINKQRILYASITLLLLVIEILIALFARDMLIRGRVGDVLVVILLYTFVRSFVPDRIRLLPLYVFLFACFAEFLQYIHIVERLGLEHNTFFKTLIGSVFDWFDVLSYGIGCILTGVYESVKKNIDELLKL